MIKIVREKKARPLSRALYRLPHTAREDTIYLHRPSAMWHRVFSILRLEGGEEPPPPTPYSLSWRVPNAVWPMRTCC